MKKLNLFLIPVLAILIYSCEETNLNIEKVDGFVQKGPYLNGTSVTLSELTGDLTPTGKNFTSQILDNKGTYEIKNVELVSQYVELKADGFYYNEVSNSNSTAQLTLFALSDLSDITSLNVNILTNLEKNRVNYLVANGMSFFEAKIQAQTEILSIFEISNEGISESEKLDITKSGDDNAILLAVSIILQGYLSVSDLSELMANISTDIREDGQLNSQSLGSALINNAKTIKLEEIRNNLETRYEELGLNITIPNFEKFVNQFIENTDFVFTNFIEYPYLISDLINILSDSITEINAGPIYCIGAKLPYGTRLNVIFKPSPGYYCNGNGIIENYGWTKNSTWCYNTNLEALGIGQIIYIEYMTGPISLDFEIFENDSPIPTKTKTVIAK